MIELVFGQIKIMDSMEKIINRTEELEKFLEIKKRAFVTELASSMAMQETKNLIVGKKGEKLAKKFDLEFDIMRHGGLAGIFAPKGISEEQGKGLARQVNERFDKVFGEDLRTCSWDRESREEFMRAGMGGFHGPGFSKEGLVFGFNYPQSKKIADLDMPEVLENFNDIYGESAVETVALGVAQKAFKLLKSPGTILGYLQLTSDEIVAILEENLSRANATYEDLKPESLDQVIREEVKKRALKYQVKYDTRSIYQQHKKFGNASPFRVQWEHLDEYIEERMTSFSQLTQNITELGGDYRLLKHDINAHYSTIGEKEEKEMEQRETMSSEEIQQELASMKEDFLSVQKNYHKNKAEEMFKDLFALSQSGNFAVNSEQIGISPDIETVSRVGFEELKKELENHLEKAGLNYDFLGGSRNETSETMRAEVDRMIDVIIAKRKAVLLNLDIIIKNPDQIFSEIKEGLSRHGLDFTALTGPDNKATNESIETMLHECVRNKKFDHKALL